MRPRRHHLHLGNYILESDAIKVYRTIRGLLCLYARLFQQGFPHDEMEPSVILFWHTVHVPVFRSDTSDTAFLIRMTLSITGCVLSFSFLLGALSDQLPLGSFPLCVISNTFTARPHHFGTS
ncbi:hypothetical protein DACRYDRAFT_25396 [Dacryopinax primogenitus]|uniref:Uncharacterized protein n=1 Tax=Dacryopinax primogenitus (strain DJM 731) TaxID=1858805 RepID=M5FQF5_DACPD|nr:uncharacterized protein DACRYDRAFT_25396 [Dacryopinax primogenitus]EJT96954.1 hypothetical protein DACRYDRAFT_25396 [Dacryopinax primogenitus]